jgi:formyltetrahydrofolate deformylase
MVIMSDNIVKLLISCPDQKGIVFEVTRFIAENGGNIIDSQQHSLGLNAKFFMRLEIDFPTETKELPAKFQEIATKFSMDFRFSSGKKRMAILVSKYDHCLYDILQKQKHANINVDIPIIISNHLDLEHVAKGFGIDYKYIPIETEKFQTQEDAKSAQEAEIIKTLKPLSIDFIAMARYMQILSADFIDYYPYRIINVHHSFLPSFKGANPYKQAFEKGVKIIGATAHYATADLDMGPIISQDVSPVNYKHSVEDYVVIGRDIEELVFARAIKAHSEDKIIVDEGKTIVFN